jgi:hypothetical protein
MLLELGPLPEDGTIVIVHDRDARAIESDEDRPFLIVEMMGQGKVAREIQPFITSTEEPAQRISEWIPGQSLRHPGVTPILDPVGSCQ